MSNTNAIGNANVGPSSRAMSLSSYQDSVASTLIIPVIGAIVMFIIFLYVTTTIVKTYNKTTLKTVSMLKHPKGIPRKNFVISNDVTLPKLYNGIEFSYSFWLFLCAEDIQNTDNNKFILARCPTNESLVNASPVFSMDGETNKMHVALKIRKNTHSPTLKGIHNDTTGYFTSTIDYVPLQRWVNVLLVVDNQFIQIFVDGELRNVEDISTNNKYRIPVAPDGSMVIGKIGGENMLNKNSFISKVQVSNYALTIDHAKLLYKAGPLNTSILSSLGINTIGIRSPFYTISAKVDNDSDEI